MEESRSSTLSYTSVLDVNGWSKLRLGRFLPGNEAGLLQEAGWASGLVWQNAENF